jgi:hypothetical protein
VTTASPDSARFRWWPVALLVLALALFAGVFFWLGGIDGVRALLNNKPDAATTPASPAASAPASAPVVPSVPDAARLAYAEQIESQSMIGHLAAGDVTSMELLSAESGETTAVAQARVRLIDGSQVQGSVRLIKSGNMWYFVTLTRTGGSVKTSGTDEPAERVLATTTAEVDAKLAAVGVKTPDQGILDTIVEQQKANQSALREVASGKRVRYDFGKVVKGPQTFTIPVTNHAEGAAHPGRIVIISKNVEGIDRLFVTTLKYD